MTEDIKSKIFTIRGLQVMLDRDLAELYGVATKRLNEQVRRNIERFPLEFRFQLTSKEKDVKVLIFTKSITRSVELDIERANEQYNSFEIMEFRKNYS